MPFGFEPSFMNVFLFYLYFFKITIIILILLIMDTKLLILLVTIIGSLKFMSIILIFDSFSMKKSSGS